METLENMLLRYFNEQKKLELLRQEIIVQYRRINSFNYDNEYSELNQKENEILCCLHRINELQKDLQESVGFKE